MLQKLISYFTPKKGSTDPDHQRRLMLVTHAILITSVFALFYVVVSWISGYGIGMRIMFITFVNDVILLFLVRAGINVTAMAYVFMLNTTNAIFCCAWFSGGMHSPVFPWLAQPPIVLLLIVGKKGGYVSALLCLLLTFLIAILSFTGYQFPSNYNPAREGFFFLSCYAGLVLIIFSITLVFEVFREQAFRTVTQQREVLQTALTELKVTQAQLVQSEKMASLGELTAGIAHEIQNPLNFVNNFSEVTGELCDEIVAEIETGNPEEAKAIAVQIKENNQKIAHHGKRADSIVKGMLQHSRSSGGIKVPTDINGLVDEYFRLSYHGLRAKDKSFNASLETRLDPALQKVEVMPQELGRVLLNLYNNSFYAVNEKKKKLANDYKPAVSVATRLVGDQVEISVKDNGTGIPQKVRDKIYQPFFTTKPTGEGTGLGLSMSYEIITKGHGGKLNVISTDGEGAEFIIQLPYKHKSVPASYGPA